MRNLFEDLYSKNSFMGIFFVYISKDVEPSTRISTLK